MDAGLLLAVDGGSSKTDVAVLRTDGTVLGRARGAGFRPQRMGTEAAMQVLEEVRADALAAAGLPSNVMVDVVAAFLAGADLPGEVEGLRQAVRARGWAGVQRVDNDTFAVLRAGATRPWGVAVVCGTGINSVGVAPDGRTAGFPALGRISGDWGGGADIGTAALWHAARSEDGRGPATALRHVVARHFGLSTVAEVTAAVHTRELDEIRLSELCPAVFAACDQGDPVAASLVDRLSDEVAAMAIALLRRLDLDTANAPEDPEVVLGGSVLAARHPRLLTGVTARLAAAVPRARPTVSVAAPVYGSALAALDVHPHTTDTAPATLRAAFAHTTDGTCTRR
ncbi:BadF/BadG/BcrA/BcrD ATPase family protein [Streptomyces sp. NPDC050625]|uniref:N-acetylglucosamine kinase n=1 Tax=Streptomyces sp. NPDC050625 TaxID=3154629 RepID=UPI0034324D03